MSVEEKESELMLWKSKYMENNELLSKSEKLFCLLVLAWAEIESARNRIEELDKEI